MVKNPSLHTLYNFLLLNLAVVGLLSRIVSIGKFIMILHANKTGVPSHVIETVTCQIFTTVIYFGILLSILTLTAIALERYFWYRETFYTPEHDEKTLKYFSR